MQTKLALLYKCVSTAAGVYSVADSSVGWRCKSPNHFDKRGRGDNRCQPSACPAICRWWESHRTHTKIHQRLIFLYVDTLQWNKFILALNWKKDFVGSFQLWFSSQCTDAVMVQKLTSVFTQLKTGIGFRLRYDGRGGRVYVQLDSQWRGQTLGLCGTYNGNLRDDFLWARTSHLHISVENVTLADSICVGRGQVSSRYDRGHSSASRQCLEGVICLCCSS